MVAKCSQESNPSSLTWVYHVAKPPCLSFLHSIQPLSQPWSVLQRWIKLPFLGIWFFPGSICILRIFTRALSLGQRRVAYSFYSRVLPLLSTFKLSSHFGWNLGTVGESPIPSPGQSWATGKPVWPTLAPDPGRSLKGQEAFLEVGPHHCLPGKGSCFWNGVAGSGSRVRKQWSCVRCIKGARK